MITKHIIIGTAGHIDHGKTKLTEALTGVNTDRLPEEKQREMSIDLGFAPFDLAEELKASIVDVPGHERFIKNMAAGVSGIDMVLFCVAADDGVMPQTIEHLQILDLLGVTCGIIALTKIDLVSKDRIDRVVEEIKTFTRDAFLADAPIIGVSAVTKDGIEAFKEAIIEIAEKVPPRSENGIFRLPIDRIFTMSGFGTVITGTLISGKLVTGSPVEILPPNIRARVRNIQVHNRPVNEAVAGQRTALNLKDVDKSDIQRGDLVTTPKLLEATTQINAKLKLLGTVKKPLKDRTRIRFHSGTSEIMARVALIGTSELEPGKSCFVQIQLEKPTVVLRKDRFIIRTYSPQITIGGGTILDGYPKQYRARLEENFKSELKIMESKDESRVIEHILVNKKSYIKSIDELAKLVNISPKAAENIIERLYQDKKVEKLGRKMVVHTEILELFKEKIRKTLDDFFKDQLYVSKTNLRTLFQKEIDSQIFETILKELKDAGIISIKEDRIEIVSHKDELKGTILHIENLYKESLFSPPNLKEVTKRSGIKGETVSDIYADLLKSNILVEVARGITFHHSAIDSAINKLRDYQKEITVSEFRQLLGTSRKYAVPLLEYLDRIGITYREGDVRVLSKKSKKSVD